MLNSLLQLLIKNTQIYSTSKISAPDIPLIQDSQIQPLMSVLRKHQNQAWFNLLFRETGRISKNEAEIYFGSNLLGELIIAGLLAESQNQIFSLFQGQWFKELFFLSDNKDFPEAVLQIGPSGKYLESITIRRKINSALDIGCGCGIQTLLLARHSKTVTATDINLRCLKMTSLNARLNNLQNIELLLGSYFEPVYGRTFDLIVTNTPYVITPKSTYIYRDVAEVGDKTVLSMMQKLPTHLNEDGFAQMTANWLHKKNQPFIEPIQNALWNTSADALLIYSTSDTAWTYAQSWIYGYIRKNAIRYFLTRIYWVLWYWLHGMERFAFGAIAFKKQPKQQYHLYSIKSKQIAGESAGEHIQSFFSAQDFLANTPTNAQILETRFNLQVLSLSINQNGHIRKVKVNKGFVVPIKLSSFMGQVLKYLSDQSTLKIAIQNATNDGFDKGESEEEVIKTIKLLLRIGYIQPLLD